MRRVLAIIATAGLALVMTGFGMAPPAAQAAPYGHCDSLFNTPGLGMDCTVAVVNNLDLATGATSSTTTYTRCSGDANTALTCEGPTTVSSTELVTSVSQCNSSLDGGGASMHCTVDITNNVVGNATAVAASVNQCNGSLGGGGTLLRACSPDPATMSGAAIDQCNNSVNGGGSSLTCSVAPGSTTSSALYVTVSQCNYSANGGGSLVVCTTALRTNVTPAEVEVEVVPPTVVPPVVPPTVVPPVVPPTVVPPVEVPTAVEREAVVQPDVLAETGPEDDSALAQNVLMSVAVVALGIGLLARRRLEMTGARA